MVRFRLVRKLRAHETRRADASLFPHARSALSAARTRLSRTASSSLPSGNSSPCSRPPTIAARCVALLGCKGVSSSAVVDRPLLPSVRQRGRDDQRRREPHLLVPGSQAGRKEAEVRCGWCVLPPSTGALSSSIADLPGFTSSSQLLAARSWASRRDLAV